MKIEITKNDDNNCVNDQNKFKIELAESLIKEFQPLFYEDIRTKQRELKKNRSEVQKLKESITSNRSKLIKLDNELNQENLREQLLLKIEGSISKSESITSYKSILETIECMTMKDLEQQTEKLKVIHTATNQRKV